MAVIYSYPVKTKPTNDDLILISDAEDQNKTKQITVSSIKGLTAGVTSIIAGNNITIDPLDGIGDVTINAASGDMQSVFDASTPNVDAIDQSKSLSLTAHEVILFANNDDPSAPATSTGELTIASIDGNSGPHPTPTWIRLKGGEMGAGELNIAGVPGQSAIPTVGDVLVIDSIDAAFPNQAKMKFAAPSSDLTIEDENNVVADAATTINFTGGGVTASGDNTQVDVEVLPRLNHGWSPISISQGSIPITIAGGSSLAFAVQGICDIAAGQLTVARIFGNLPRGCRVNVAVYTGSLTFQGSTALVYFGSLKNQNGVPGVSSTNTDDNSFINNIFYIDEPVGTSNNWVPVAGTPIITIIEIDNVNGVDGQNNPEDAVILGQQTVTPLTPNTFLKTLSFAVAPPQNQTSIFNNTNTELGKQVNTVLNFGSAQPTDKRVCQHFDPDK